MGRRRAPSYWWDFHWRGDKIAAIHVESDADWLPDPIRVFPVDRGACDHLIETVVMPFIDGLEAGRIDPRRAQS